MTHDNSNTESKKDPKSHEKDFFSDLEQLKKQIEAVKQIQWSTEPEKDPYGGLRDKLEEIAKKRLAEIVDDLDKGTQKKEQANNPTPTVEPKTPDEEPDKELCCRNKCVFQRSWVALWVILGGLVVSSWLSLLFSIIKDWNLPLFIGSMSILLVLAMVAIVILCQIKSFSCPKSEKSSE